jgi:tetratricopeptide (TPR) repeat protein
MTLHWSPSCGVLLRGECLADSTVESVGDLADASQRWLNVAGLVSDWTPLDRERIDASGLATLQTEHRIERATGLVRRLLMGAPEPLRTNTLAAVEELIQLGAKPDRIRSWLLAAPLRSPQDMEPLVTAALAAGLGATAHVLNSVRELQPQIQRVSNAWISLIHDLSEPSTSTPTSIWRSLAWTGSLVGLVESADRGSVATTIFTFVTSLDVSARKSAWPILNRLLERLFPSKAMPSIHSEIAVDPDRPEAPSDFASRTHDRSRFQRALRQVTEIVHALEQGRDDRAITFLDTLVREQQSEPEHAIKSLCNIAQQCKDMFRADFERVCLDRAASLGARDTWLLVQYGDHLKRCGQYEDARSVFGRAASFAVGTEEIVARSAQANVSTEEGLFERAESEYKLIPDWHSILEVRVALADISRLRGDDAAAESAYREILDRWPGEPRPIVGLAELQKRRGMYADAATAYEKLLESGVGDPRGRQIWRMALAHILKVSGRPDRALQLLDDVVQGAPFLMRARALRCATLGLLGRERDAIELLPPRAQRAQLGEWLQQFVRGLLLHKLRRFEEAHGQLVERFRETLVAPEGAALLRLGAAVELLASGEDAEAAAQLRSLPKNVGLFESYVERVVALHLAVKTGDAKERRRWLEEIRSSRRAEPLVDAAVHAIERGDFHSAIALEVELLLRAA